MKKEGTLIANKAQFDKHINKAVINKIKEVMKKDYEKFLKEGSIKQISFKEFVQKTIFLMTTNAIIENQLKITEQMILAISVQYVIFFNEKFSDIDDILKTIDSRKHWFNDCELSLSELTYKLLVSIANNEFSAQLLLRFACKGLLEE